MWWLIKGSFWFSLILILIPLFNTASSERLAHAPPMEMADAFTAVTGAYAYVTNLCTDRPEVCDKGAKTFTALGYRAKEGARLAFDYLNTKFADTPATAVAAHDRKPSTAPAAVAASSTPSTAPASGPSGLTTLTALLTTAAEAEKAVTSGAAAQPMPGQPTAGKPAPYRPPVADKVVTGTVPSASADAGFTLTHIPVPLPRPQPDA